MDSGNFYKNNKDFLINSIDTDFRAEAVAAGLINAGQDPDRTLIVRQRGDKRDVSKDINKIKVEYSGYDLMEYLYVYTNRLGIYDSLPEGIFHQSENRKKQKTQEDIIQEIRSHRDEEFFARRYFQPFEMVLDQLLIEAQAYEQKFDKAYFYSNLKEIFKDQWDILKNLSLKQALLFIKIIPIIAEASQSLNLMANIMGVILDCPVSIQEGKKSKQQLSPEQSITLGKWKLGINSVLGKSIDSDDVSLDITVGPISPKQMRLFESNASNNLILKELIDLIVPFDRSTNIKYRILKENTKFRLSNDTHKAYLGINTTL